MDDGHIDTFKATHLNTNSYTKNEIKLLQDVLLKKFKLKTRIDKKKENQWKIVITVRQPIPLAEIVGPYMHESMRYKVVGLT